MGKAAEAGTVFALRGGLGAGKTALCRGIAKGLGVQDPVTSPTYTLINEYEGTLPFYHFDAYRLGSASEFERLDSVRYLYGDGVCAIEWSERVAEALPGDAVVVEIEPADDGHRLVRIFGERIEGALS
jgi:tRNA threonylcarbamoyladenosine biosynthesis protein TsaE